jgi:pyruvate formate lyase activating enzyme
MTADDLAIAGFVPFSSIDWPTRLAATVFLQGCPWSCGYCQNPDLIDPLLPGTLAWRAIRETLGRRVGLLDGVVFSGGEPLRQAALAEAIDEVRDMGFLAAVHTAGSYPARLEALLPSLAWVGLDIKAPPRLYAAVTGVEASGARAWESLDLVVASGIDYEVRVTVDPTVLGLSDVEEIVGELGRRGARMPVLQEVRAMGSRPEYAARLGTTRLADIVPEGVFPGIERRVEHVPIKGAPSVREVLTSRDDGASDDQRMSA